MCEINILTNCIKPDWAMAAAGFSAFRTVPKSCPPTTFPRTEVQNLAVKTGHPAGGEVRQSSSRRSGDGSGRMSAGGAREKTDHGTSFQGVSGLAGRCGRA